MRTNCARRSTPTGSASSGRSYRSCATRPNDGRRHSTARGWPTLLEAVDADTLRDRGRDRPRRLAARGALDRSSGSTSSRCSTTSRPSRPAMACTRCCTRTPTRWSRRPTRSTALLDGSTVPICLDTGHVTIGGADALELAERVAARVGLVHLKDVRTAVAARFNADELSLMAAVQAGLFAPLGDGDVPIADVVTTLERQRLRRPVRARAGRGHHRPGTTRRRWPGARRRQERRVPPGGRSLTRCHGARRDRLGWGRDFTHHHT